MKIEIYDFSSFLVAMQGVSYGNLRGWCHGHVASGDPMYKHELGCEWVATHVERWSLCMVSDMREGEMPKSKWNNTLINAQTMIYQFS